MKCQFILKTVRNSLLVCLLFGGVASKDACAGKEAIEVVFSKAKMMVTKKNPSFLPKLNAFEEKIYQLLRSFLDMSNNESFATHVGYIEQNIASLKAEFVLHKDFHCIKNLIGVFHEELSKLVIILKSYIGTRSPGKLGAALFGFQHLLPKIIVKEVGGIEGLHDRLTHRLGC